MPQTLSARPTREAGARPPALRSRVGRCCVFGAMAMAVALIVAGLACAAVSGTSDAAAVHTVSVGS